MKPGDVASVLSFSTSSSISVIQEFVSDRQKLHDAIESIDPQSGGESDSRLDEHETDQRLGTLLALAKDLTPMPERKALIYFRSSVLKSGTSDQTHLRAVVAAARRTNLSVYTIDVRGLADINGN